MRMMFKWQRPGQQHYRRRALGVLAVLAVGALAPAAPTALSPDQRPVLILVAPPTQLMLVHHADPLPPGRAEQLALKLGLFIAAPIIRWHAHESTEALPPPWRTAQPDRGFAGQLNAALDRTSVNWPWRSLRIVRSGAEAEALLMELRGQEVAIATFGFELVEHARSVQLESSARLSVVHAAATERESRTQFTLRHFEVPLAANRSHPQQSIDAFSAGGELDQMVRSAALDESRALAVTVARAVTPAAGTEPARRHFADLANKPKCSECRPGDPVLHEEPGRVWVAPAHDPGTILSLPVS